MQNAGQLIIEQRKETTKQNKKIGNKSWVTETKDTPIKLHQTNIKLNFGLKTL